MKVLPVTPIMPSSKSISSILTSTPPPTGTTAAAGTPTAITPTRSTIPIMATPPTATTGAST